MNRVVAVKYMLTQICNIHLLLNVKYLISCSIFIWQFKVIERFKTLDGWEIC